MRVRIIGIGMGPHQVTPEAADALRDADYVIVTFQVGGLDAYKLDVEIPRRYGLDQTVGDTLGPGGVFRALRTMRFGFGGHTEKKS